MKLNKIVMALVLAFSTVSGAQAADQGHGKVTFTGSIIDAPCSITPQSIDQTVDLGQISKEALLSGGKSTPRNFSIGLENCSFGSPATKNKVQVTFTGMESAAKNGLLGLPELLKVPVLPLLRQMVKSSSWGYQLKSRYYRTVITR